MPTWERMWDDFVQEEIRLAAEASGQRQQQQQQIGQGEEDLALWTKGKKKARPWGSTGSQVWGPTTGEWRRREQQWSGQWSEERYEQSEVLCL
jgi:hypothetical protein